MVKSLLTKRLCKHVVYGSGVLVWCRALPKSPEGKMRKAWWIEISKHFCLIPCSWNTGMVIIRNTQFSRGTLETGMIAAEETCFPFGLYWKPRGGCVLIEDITSLKFGFETREKSWQFSRIGIRIPCEILPVHGNFCLTDFLGVCNSWGHKHISWSRDILRKGNWRTPLPNQQRIQKVFDPCLSGTAFYVCILFQWDLSVCNSRNPWIVMFVLRSSAVRWIGLGNKELQCFAWGYWSAKSRHLKWGILRQAL